MWWCKMGHRDISIFSFATCNHLNIIPHGFIPSTSSMCLPGLETMFSHSDCPCKRKICQGLKEPPCKPNRSYPQQCHRWVPVALTHGDVAKQKFEGVFSATPVRKDSLVACSNFLRSFQNLSNKNVIRSRTTKRWAILLFTDCTDSHWLYLYNPNNSQ